jgi:hypothetical protein
MMQRPLRRDEVVESIRFVVPGTVAIHDAGSQTGLVARQGTIEVTIQIGEAGQQITSRVLAVTP